MKLETKIADLTRKLRERNNNAYKFFESILADLENENKSKEAIERLASCYSITQYADLTYEEEQMLGEIIDNLGNHPNSEGM